MIYQFLIKSTEILAIATSRIAHLCNSYNHIFALLIAMPRFNSINFYQKRPKIKLFLPKSTKFLGAGGSASRPP